MPSIVHWRLMFRVANRQAFEKCMGRTLPLIGPDCEVGQGKPYWKIPELWECGVTSPACGDTPSEQVLAVLLTAKRLGNGWYVLGPLSTDNAIGFNGVFSISQNHSTNVVGLEWASFEIARQNSLDSAEPIPSA